MFSGAVKGKRKQFTHTLHIAAYICILVANITQIVRRLGYWLVDRRIGIRFLAGAEMSLFINESRTVSGVHQHSLLPTSSWRSA
jgi:hypothetical protein